MEHLCLPPPHAENRPSCHRATPTHLLLDELLGEQTQPPSPQMAKNPPPPLTCCSTNSSVTTSSMLLSCNGAQTPPCSVVGCKSASLEALAGDGPGAASSSSSSASPKPTISPSFTPAAQFPSESRSGGAPNRMLPPTHTHENYEQVRARVRWMRGKVCVRGWTTQMRMRMHATV